VLPNVLHFRLLGVCLPWNLFFKPPCTNPATNRQVDLQNEQLDVVQVEELVCAPALEQVTKFVWVDLLCYWQRP